MYPEGMPQSEIDVRKRIVADIRNEYAHLKADDYALVNEVASRIENGELG